MEKLRVEIVHRIFDHLDIETLFVQFVDQLFRLKMRFDFHSMIISKPHFDVFCRFTSLTLSNNELIPDLISLFLRQLLNNQIFKIFIGMFHIIENLESHDESIV